MKKIFLVFLVQLFLISCASKSGNEVSATSPKFTLLFSEQRQLQIEPCGCSLGQLGGLEREYNFLNKFRAAGNDPLYVSGSASFYPAEKFEKRLLSQYQAKAKLIAQAFAKFQMGAYMPDQKDLCLGTNFIKSLSRTSGVPFISSNMVDAKNGKPVFLERLQVLHQNTPVLILGLSGANPDNIKQKGNVKFLPAQDVLKKELAQAQNRLVVVIHSLEQEEVLDLTHAFPGVHLWLGGNRRVTPDDVFQYSKNSLNAEVLGWGRTLLRFDLEPKFPIEELYQTTQRKYQLERTKVLAKRKTQIDRSVASSEEELEVIERRLKLLAQVPETPGANAVAYRFERYDLGSEYAGKNEFTAQIEKSRHLLGGETLE